MISGPVSELIAPKDESLSLATQTFCYLMGEMGEWDRLNSVWWGGPEIGWTLNESQKYRMTSSKEAAMYLKKQTNLCKDVSDQRIINESQELVQEIRYYVRSTSKELSPS